MKEKLQIILAGGVPVLLGLVFGVAVIVTQLPHNKDAAQEEAPKVEDTAKPATATTSTADLSAAANTVKSTCATCHGADLKGAFGPNLYEKSKQLSEAQIVDVLKNGKGKMPVGVVPADQAEAIAKYIKSLSSN